MKVVTQSSPVQRSQPTRHQTIRCHSPMVLPSGLQQRNPGGITPTFVTVARLGKLIHLLAVGKFSLTKKIRTEQEYNKDRDRGRKNNVERIIRRISIIVTNPLSLNKRLSRRSSLCKAVYKIVYNIKKHSSSPHQIEIHLK